MVCRVQLLVNILAHKRGRTSPSAPGSSHHGAQSHASHTCTRCPAGRQDQRPAQLPKRVWQLNCDKAGGYARDEALLGAEERLLLLGALEDVRGHNLCTVHRVPAQSLSHCTWEMIQTTHTRAWLCIQLLVHILLRLRIPDVSRRTRSPRQLCRYPRAPLQPGQRPRDRLQLAS